MGVSRVAATLGGVGLACFAYGALIERRWYRLRRVPVEGVLRRPGRLTILHLSDIHLIPGQEHRTRFLASLADAGHDLVVVTGDLLGAPDTEAAVAEALAPATSGGRPGLVVLGSNDRYGPVPKSPLSYLRAPRQHPRPLGTRLDTDLLVKRLAEHGYRTLVDETVRLTTPAGEVAAGALDDPHLATTVLPDVDAVSPSPGDEIVRLGIVHAPYLAALDLLVEAGHDLLLAGHTHGGQVRLPPFGALVSNCDLPLDQVRGLSAYRGRWLHVSPGLGHSRYAPFRFACRPEATLLELTG